MSITQRTTRLVNGRNRTILSLMLAAVALPLAACGTTTEPPPPAPPQVQPAGGSLTKDDVDTWLDGVLPPALETTGIPGATVSVVADGQILTARGFGVADTGTGGGPSRPVDPDNTLFRIGSVSKAVTATAVMRLVESGDLDLDSDVRDYLDFDLATPKGTVTLRHLLSHTGGFEERIRGLIRVGEGVSLRESVSVDPPTQVFQPGTTPAYSNYGNALAGYIVERVTGQPFAKAVADLVLEPAGMVSSSFAQPLPDDLVNRLALGYPDDTQAPASFEYVADAPAGAMSATSTDMARFMLAHLNSLPVEEPLLSAETLAAMHSPALGEDSLGTLAHGERMTLGLFDEDRNGHKGVGHGGDTQVFHSEMRIYPDAGLGIFVSLNGSGRDAMDSYELRAALADGFADRYLPAGTGTPETSPDSTSGEISGTSSPGPTPGTDNAMSDAVNIAVDEVEPVELVDVRARAAAAAGTYESTRVAFTNFGSVLRLSGQTTVTPRDDGTLLVTPGPVSATPAVYEEISPWTWREVGGQTLLAMRADDDGAVEAIGWGSAFTMIRVDPAHNAAVAVPILLTSVVGLIAAGVGWPARAVIRRRLKVTRVQLPGRFVRILTQVGVGATLTAVLGWAVIFMMVLSYQDVPDAPLRVVQALQLASAVTLVPASLHLINAIRFREGVLAVISRTAVVLALVGVTWFALVFRFLAPSVSY